MTKRFDDILDSVEREAFNLNVKSLKDPTEMRDGMNFIQKKLTRKILEKKRQYE